MTEREPFDAPFDVERARRADAAEAGPGAEPLAGVGALGLLRRGMAVTPELRAGLTFTITMAVATAAGRLVVPVLIQQIVDRGLLGAGGFRPAFVYSAGALALVVIVGVRMIASVTQVRLVRAAEAALAALRVRVFAHVHRLGLEALSSARRGTLVSRVTSDIETLAQFSQWGGISWVVNSTLIVGTTAVMLAYSWRLAILVVAVFLPLLAIIRRLQRLQLAAYDQVRTRVGDTLGELSEAVGGASVVRAYGLEPRAERRLRDAIQRQYDAQVRAVKWFAVIFALPDVFGSVAIASVVAAGSTWGPAWGLGVGELIAFLFLVNLLLTPIAELGEIIDQTQNAIAGFRKVLGVLEMAVEIPEPSPGVALPGGALEVELRGVRFGYRGGPEVLHAIDLAVPAGVHAAIVGQTGSGKTTLAKLLCRLADPTAGAVRIGDVDLREVAAGSRRDAIRLVPQDGFLFDTTVRENVRYGRLGASDADVDRAFDALGLRGWIDRLPTGLDTPVGERGESLSVGERQLVALARAQLADPGLLILDEATSAVDPDTERALAAALARIAAGRTTVAIAHRLSTAEEADLVIVMDAGHVVEIGTHDDLVAAGGTYARLYRTWLGNTRAA